MEEAEDDTDRSSELITLAEVGLQAEEDAFLSQAADEVGGRLLQETGRSGQRV